MNSPSIAATLIHPVNCLVTVAMSGPRPFKPALTLSLTLVQHDSFNNNWLVV